MGNAVFCLMQKESVGFIGGLQGYVWWITSWALLPAYVTIWQ